MADRRLFTLACFAAFVVMGTASSILGPTLPDLAASLALPLASAGILRAAQQIGMIGAILAGGRLLDRFNPRYAILPGVLLMAVGLVGLIASGNLVIALAASAILGIGSGLLNLGANVAIGALYESNAAPVLAALHTFFGLGLFGGPLIAEWSMTRQEHWQSAYIVSSILCAGLGLLFARLSINIRSNTLRGDVEQPTIRPAVAWLPLLPLILLLFLYNGAGSGLADWLATHLQLVAHTGVDTASQVTALYGLAITAGRIISIEALRRLGNMSVLTLAIGIATVGAALIVLGGAQVGMIAAGVLMVGIGFAPIYPTVIAIGGQQQPENRGNVTGILAGLAAIGGVFVPIIQGRIGNGQNGGMIVTLAAALIMIASLAWIASDKTRHRRGKRARDSRDNVVIDLW
jgi:fucose permease